MLGGFVEAILNLEEYFGGNDISNDFRAGLRCDGVQDVVELMQHVESHDGKE